MAVYADGCQAAKDVGGWIANYYDSDSDCIVDLGDYSVFAAEWLNDTSMLVQEEYTGVAGYIPQAVYDSRIEAEWYDPNDQNAFSGCIIQENEGASGGQNIGNNGGGSWVDYEITVPVSAVGVAVDVYIGYGLASGTRTVSFGTEGEGMEALYGTAEASSTDDWYNFAGHYGGEVTFTASGPQEIRVTCPSGGLNLDWFSIDFP